MNNGIPIEDLEALLEAISAVKVQILNLDPSPQAKRDLDEAYVGLSSAQRALLKLIAPSEVGGHR